MNEQSYITIASNVASPLVNPIYANFLRELGYATSSRTTCRIVTRASTTDVRAINMSQQQKKPATQKTSKQSTSTQQAPKQKPSTQADREREHEARKAAQKSLKLQKQAKELINAAAGAGDPDERQKLLQQALEKEVEAGTFGKTARYLNTGEFQGLCAGAGLGAGIGIGLGTLTGTIVGGTTGSTLR